MRAIILAAGRGSRISRYLSGKPKCTVDIGGERLIRYTVDLLKKKGIKEVAIVLGYRGEAIKEVLADFNVSFYENPFYDVTNSIASIWFAKSFLCEDDDTLIMNGDVYLEEALLDKIINSRKSPMMFADNSRKEEADYKFFYQDGILKKYGKELELEETSGEYIGVGVFRKDFVPKFLTRLEELIHSQNHSVWWENVIYSMAKETDIYVEEIDSLFWAEVDYIEDYERILSYRGYEADFNISVKQHMMKI